MVSSAGFSVEPFRNPQSEILPPRLHSVRLANQRTIMRKNLFDGEGGRGNLVFGRSISRRPDDKAEWSGTEMAQIGK
jgi:hypothetical protein